MPKRQGRFPLRDKVEEIDRIYRLIAREIIRVLSKIDIGDYRELKVMEIRESINRLITMLNRSAVKWTERAVPEAYHIAEEISRIRLEILGINKNGDFQKKTHKQTIEYEIKIMIDDLIKANQSIKQDVAVYLYLAGQAAMSLSRFQAFDMRDEAFIDDLLDDALRAGETRGYAMRKVKNYYKDRFGEMKFININGRNYEMRAYADLVAKTRLRVVQTKAVLNSCKEYENDLVEVSDHGTDCLICQEFEGRIYSLSGQDPIYPYLDIYTPFHPRCQHNIRPTSEIAIESRRSNA